MSNTARNSEALEALRSFNTAITTKRLYPPSAPQVSTSVEKAFQAIKRYLRTYGGLSFSNLEIPTVVGVPVQHKTLGKIEGFEFFKLLELLNLKHMVLQPGLQQVHFNAILEAITTPHQQIEKEGGVRAFLHRQELNGFFPEDVEVVVEQVENDKFSGFLEKHGRKIARWEQFVGYLKNDLINEKIEREIKKELQTPKQTAELLTALIAVVFHRVETVSGISTDLPIAQILLRIENLISPEISDEAVGETANELLKNFKGYALNSILVQDFPSGFAANLFNAVISNIGIESFSEVMTQLESEEAKLKRKHGVDSARYQQIQARISGLLNTLKGKQYLSREKAQALLKAGESERRAKRIQAGLNSILQGSVVALKNDEILEYLPASVSRLLANDKLDLAAAIIEKLARELIKEEGSLETERLANCIGSIGEDLIKRDKWEWLENLAVPLLSWLKKIDSDDRTCEKILHILNKIMQRSWKIKRNVRGDQILNMFYGIRSGMLEKSQGMRKLVTKVQDQAVDRTLLEMFLKHALSETADEVSRTRLNRQGTFAAKYLINELLESKKLADRMKMLDILEKMGDILPPVLEERLKDPMPWYGKRNLIKLLAETGNEENVESVLEYMKHDDLRVQREAFICLYRNSGERRKEVLLAILAIASEQMKIQTVKALQPYTDDDDVAREMVGLLEMQDSFSIVVRNSLLIQVCRHLGLCSPEIALDPLREFQKTKGKGTARKLDRAVWEVVEDSLSNLRAIVRAEQDLEQGEEFRHISDIKESITDFPEERQAVFLHEKGRSEEAVQLLLKMIIKSTRFKKFDQAEKLKEWLTEVDPSAITEIIKASEIISEEKGQNIDSGHLTVWAKLYDSLTTDEFNAFYLALEHHKCEIDELIVKQGDSQSCLYFINSGRVKLYYQMQEKEILVCTMGAGEVLGTGSFFDASVWTINVSSINQVDMSILRLERLSDWKNEFPDLGSKLQDFCSQFETVPLTLQNLGKTRRGEERTLISGAVLVSFLDRDGSDTQMKAEGELSDICAGGISFLLRSSQKSNARILLGRKVRLRLPLGTNESEDREVEGIVMAVRSLRSIANDYSLHIKFDEELTSDDMESIHRTCS
jgi:hypothetical protein